MWTHDKIAAETAGEVIGELTRFAAELGSPDLAELAAPPTGLELGRVRNLAELRQFLHCYGRDVLITLELPVICRAYRHAERSEARELIALDAGLEHDPRMSHLARASHHVGRSQLRKLRPLRDQRFVQRYIAAVESGQARAWHTTVFGMVLALFSLPLRQGLIHYSTETLNGFIFAAAGRLQLPRAACGTLLNECLEPVPRAVDELLIAGAGELCRRD